MASWVEIANMAGAAIGTETRITSPEDDRTLARSLRAVWDLQRRAAIRDGSWNCFIQRHRLPELTARPAFGYDHQYKLPAACLRLLAVANDPAYDDYQLEGGKILCNITGPLDIRCLVDLPEPAEWDDLFVEAFALRLAWAIGTKIAGTSFDKEKVWRSYQDALSAAKRVDAIENPPIGREESDWVTARWMPSGWSPRA